MWWLARHLWIAGVLTLTAGTVPTRAQTVLSIHKGKIEVQFAPHNTLAAMQVLDAMHAILGHYEQDLGLLSPVPNGQKYLVKVVDVIEWPPGTTTDWGGVFIRFPEHIQLVVENNELPQMRYGTVYHELFHAVQDKYVRPGNDWLAEATAVAMADHVLLNGVPANSSRGTVTLPVINYPRPLEGADLLRGDKSPSQKRYFENWQLHDLFEFQNGKHFQYDGGMFAHFLMQRGGSTSTERALLPKQIYEAHQQDPSADITAILSEALQGAPALRQAMGDFGATLATGSLLAAPYTYPVQEVTIVDDVNRVAKPFPDVGGGDRYLGNYDPTTGEIVPRRVDIASRRMAAINLARLAAAPATPGEPDHPLLIGILESNDIEVRVVGAQTPTPESARLLPEVGPAGGPELYVMDDFRQGRDLAIVTGVNTTFDNQSQRSLRLVAISGRLPILEEVVVRDPNGDVYNSIWLESEGSRTQDTLELGIELLPQTSFPATITLDFEVTANVELAGLSVGDATGTARPGADHPLTRDLSLAGRFAYTGSATFDIDQGQQSIAFSFEGTDTFGHELDGDPATVAQYVPWQDATHWVNYEDHSGAGSAGGMDRNHTVSVTSPQSCGWDTVDATLWYCVEQATAMSVFSVAYQLDFDRCYEFYATRFAGEYDRTQSFEALLSMEYSVGTGARHRTTECFRKDETEDWRCTLAFLDTSIAAQGGVPDMGVRIFDLSFRHRLITDILWSEYISTDAIIIDYTGELTQSCYASTGIVPLRNDELWVSTPVTFSRTAP